MTPPVPTDAAHMSELSMSYAVGTRLLVSGAEHSNGDASSPPAAAGCGFTRYYDDATAETWRTVFANIAPVG